MAYYNEKWLEMLKDLGTNSEKVAEHTGLKAQHIRNVTSPSKEKKSGFPGWPKFAIWVWIKMNQRIKQLELELEEAVWTQKSEKK